MYCSAACFLYLVVYVAVSALTAHKELCSYLSSCIPFSGGWPVAGHLVVSRLSPFQKGCREEPCAGDVLHMERRSARLHSWSGSSGSHGVSTCYFVVWIDIGRHVLLTLMPTPAWSIHPSVQGASEMLPSQVTASAAFF